jgi:hypothetical protein
MTTKQVAEGYGISPITIRRHIMEYKEDLIEGKHYLKGVQIMNTLAGSNLQPHQTFWTKRGIVRLGFFIKSERARLFRDWAEDLIIYASERAQIVEAPSHMQVRQNLPEFFAQWIKRGQLKKLAITNNYSYHYIRNVKCGNKHSQAVELLLFELCLRNQRENANIKRIISC